MRGKYRKFDPTKKLARVERILYRELHTTYPWPAGYPDYKDTGIFAAWYVVHHAVINAIREQFEFNARLTSEDQKFLQELGVAVDDGRQA